MFKKKWILLLSLSIVLIFSACSQKSSSNHPEAISGSLTGVKENRLTAMKYKYSGKEERLLSKIKNNLQKQNSLARSTNQLSREMSSLNQKIKNLHKESQVTKEEKSKLYTEIKEKEEAIYTLQKINHSVHFNSSTYYKTIRETDISTTDQEIIQESLSDVLKNLNSVEEASIYNLKQLKLFKKKLS